MGYLGHQEIAKKLACLHKNRSWKFISKNNRKKCDLWPKMRPKINSKIHAKIDAKNDDFLDPLQKSADPSFWSNLAPPPLPNLPPHFTSKSSAHLKNVHRFAQLC